MATFGGTQVPMYIPLTQDYCPHGDMSDEVPSDYKVYEVPFSRNYGREESDKLMSWFAGLARPDEADPAAKDTVASRDRDVLIFPTSLSKAERAHWHSHADKAGLESSSQGVGDDRFLTVGLPGASAAGGSRPKRPSYQKQQRAKQIWNWCQEEGGTYLHYSQGEILDLLLTATAAPPDLARLFGKRDMAKRLIGHLQAKRSEAALALLEKDKSLALLKDGECGGYPLHVACYHGLESVVAAIIEENPATLEQVDSRKATPLQVARRRGHRAIERLLLEALETSSDSSGTVASSSAVRKPKTQDEAVVASKVKVAETEEATTDTTRDKAVEEITSAATEPTQTDVAANSNAAAASVTPTADSAPAADAKAAAYNVHKQSNGQDARAQTGTATPSISPAAKEIASGKPLPAESSDSSGAKPQEACPESPKKHAASSSVDRPETPGEPRAGPREGRQIKRVVRKWSVSPPKKRQILNESPTRESQRHPLGTPTPAPSAGGTASADASSQSQAAAPAPDAAVRRQSGAQAQSAKDQDPLKFTDALAGSAAAKSCFDPPAKTGNATHELPAAPRTSPPCNGASESNTSPIATDQIAGKKGPRPSQPPEACNAETTVAQSIAKASKAVPDSGPAPATVPQPPSAPEPAAKVSEARITGSAPHLLDELLCGGTVAPAPTNLAGSQLSKSAATKPAPNAPGGSPPESRGALPTGGRRSTDATKLREEAGGATPAQAGSKSGTKTAERAEATRGALARLGLVRNQAEPTLLPVTAAAHNALLCGTAQCKVYDGIIRLASEEGVPEDDILPLGEATAKLRETAAALKITQERLLATVVRLEAAAEQPSLTCTLTVPAFGGATPVIKTEAAGSSSGTAGAASKASKA